MKQLITRTLTSLTLAIVGLAIAAPAQTTHTVKVNVPFEFNFGDQTFPAGDYTVTQPEQNVVVLRDARGHAVAQALSVGVESNLLGDAKLKFATVDGVRYLTEIWDGTDVIGQEITRAREQALFGKHRSAESREAAEGSRP